MAPQRPSPSAAAVTTGGRCLLPTSCPHAVLVACVGSQLCMCGVASGQCSIVWLTRVTAMIVVKSSNCRVHCPSSLVQQPRTDTREASITAHTEALKQDTTADSLIVEAFDGLQPLHMLCRLCAQIHTSLAEAPLCTGPQVQLENERVGFVRGNVAEGSNAALPGHTATPYNLAASSALASPDGTAGPSSMSTIMTPSAVRRGQCIPRLAWRRQCALLVPHHPTDRSECHRHRPHDQRAL